MAEAPKSETTATGQTQGPLENPAPSGATLPASGSQVFDNLEHRLTAKELTESGTSKLLLELLRRTEQDRDEFKPFVAKFHGADRSVGILEEQVKLGKAVEIGFTFFVALGGVLLGAVFAAPFPWNVSIGLCGGLTMAGAILMRWKR
jgi:hypothetical protein